MGEHSAIRTWAMRTAFFGLCLLIIFFHLLPLDTMPRRWAPPDLLIAFSLAWTLRRPDYAPVLTIALVILLADLLFHRPPGLLPIFVVLGAHFLRNRLAGPGESGFAAEWVAVAFVVIGITVGYRVSLAIFAVDQAPLALSLFQMFLTILVYPLVVLITEWVMGVRRSTSLDPGGLNS
jgi:rod shape-determining protein MreD